MIYHRHQLFINCHMPGTQLASRTRKTNRLKSPTLAKLVALWVMGRDVWGKDGKDISKGKDQNAMSQGQ